MAEGLEQVRAAIAELRELARGIHPAILTDTGLRPPSRRSRIARRCRSWWTFPRDRYPPSVESAAYFIVAEALTNVAKYANARTARVSSQARPTASSW